MGITSGSVATVAKPMGEVQRRAKPVEEASMCETCHCEPCKCEPVQETTEQSKPEAAPKSKEWGMWANSFRKTEKKIGKKKTNESHELLARKDNGVAESELEEGIFDKKGFIGKIKRGSEANKKGWQTFGQGLGAALRGDEKGTRKGVRNSNRYYNLTHNSDTARTPGGFPKSTYKNQEIDEVYHNDYDRQQQDQMDATRRATQFADRAEDEREPLRSAKWYVVINGKVWKKMGTAVEFSTQEAANRAGHKILAKDPSRDIKLTQNSNYGHDELEESKTEKRTDMTGKTCEKCKKDKYKERDLHDDMDGKVACSCGHRVNRWKK